MCHGIQRIVSAATSRFQDVVIADIGPYGRALVLDGRLQLTSADEYLYHEPIVLVPLILRETPRSVLILGGADGGAANLARNWRTVEKVTVVDIDEVVLDACRRHMHDVHQGCFDDSRVECKVANALEFLKDSTELYDVIIGDLTDPTTEGPSIHLFEAEYFAQVKMRLRPGGFFSIQAGSVSLVEEPSLHARIHNTLRTVFSCVESFASFIPSYGTPLGFCIATDFTGKDLLDPVPDPSSVLSQQLASSARAMDTRFYRGLFGIPKSVRAAIDEERGIVAAGKHGT